MDQELSDAVSEEMGSTGVKDFLKKKVIPISISLFIPLAYGAFIGSDLYKYVPSDVHVIGAMFGFDASLVSSAYAGREFLADGEGLNDLGNFLGAYIFSQAIAFGVGYGAVCGIRKFVGIF